MAQVISELLCIESVYVSPDQHLNHKINPTILKPQKIRSLQYILKGCPQAHTFSTELLKSLIVVVFLSVQINVNIPILKNSGKQ